MEGQQYVPFQFAFQPARTDRSEIADQATILELTNALTHLIAS